MSVKERAGEKGVEAGVVVELLVIRGELAEENMSAAGVTAEDWGGKRNLVLSSSDEWEGWREGLSSEEEPEMICWRRETLRAED